MDGREHPTERWPATAPAPCREIRSARFPRGLPDRSDTTVVEAFDDAWLLLEQEAGGWRLVGVACDYEAARAWLTGTDAGPPA